MNPAPDIIGIGVCTVDYLVIVPRLPQRNENMRARRFARELGGLASIALVAAARLGARARLIARIGDDEAGAYIRAALRKEGIDVSQLLVEAGGESQVSVIVVDEPSGDRSIMTRLPTSQRLAAGELRREDFAAARVLFVDNCNAATLQAAQWARAAGAHVLLDPSQPYAEIAPLLEHVTVPIVPEAWARAWLPDQPPSAVAERLCQQGAEIAIVTRGERGAVASWDGQTQSFPAFAVDVVDTTGAGDAYHGAFMYALLQGWDVPRMASFAAAVGALNCRALGGRSALPSLDEVERFLARSID
ncbi:MAG: PfkB family carbohydrate kinase [Chloroflexi bacterium]|nr:PfkB family carbohydrate kinase [Chloroflexota bacterium]MCY3583586.1 PfkB family carbohydrate kinase [Chloroflexota bacterium]MCY3715770.1 PfkB family carbohydrate kinase [Chloroflexota bacterium]MDE2651502.1 PfkB family carbohydrate kinase [Chloroflexota bacterium]